MIRLGVIGAGAVVQRVHWPVLKEMGKQIRVVAVASRRAKNARAFARQAGSARVYNDYREMLFLLCGIAEETLADRPASGCKLHQEAIRSFQHAACIRDASRDVSHIAK